MNSTASNATLTELSDSELRSCNIQINLLTDPKMDELDELQLRVQNIILRLISRTEK